MRKCKVGIDYFSHDVDMLQDKKIKLIKAKHGLLGYAVYLRLLEELYKESGYYLNCDDDFNTLFADDNNLDYNAYILILNDCIKGDLFNNKLYKDYSILTSKRIQENYCSATERRKSVDFYKEYLLIDVMDTYNKDVNVNILSLNSHISTQSKVNKSRVNKSIHTDDENTDLFDLFYKEYPRKVGKTEALKAWNKLNVTDTLFQEIMAGLKGHKKSRDWLKDGGQFIPHPSTWLNQKRWEDELQITLDAGGSEVKYSATGAIRI